MNKISIAIVAAVVSLTGCAFDDSGDVLGSEESLHHRLGTRENLVLEPTSLVGVAAVDENGEPVPCIQPTVVGGTAVLRSTEDGLLLVEDLEIEMSDITIQEGIVLNQDIHLTDIVLSLGTQIVVEADWTAAGVRAHGFGTADLLLDWATVADSGNVYPLATQRLRDSEFYVEVKLEEDGSITASVTSSVEGELASFTNKVQLSDFSMAVEAVTPDVVPQ
jgi:hypothetical protein